MSPRPDGAADQGRRELRLLVLVVAVGGLLRFVGLGHQSLWLDESATVDDINRPLTRVVGWVHGHEAAPPLYFVVLWVWSKLFGPGAIALRSLSALCGTAMIPVSYAAGRVCASRRVGLAVAALVAVNPFLIWYSQEARPYAFLALTAALSFLFFAKAMRAPRRSWLVWWVITSGVAVLTNYFAGFLVAAEAGWLVVAQRRRAVLAAVAALAAIVLALVPLALSGPQHVAWVARMPLSFRLEQVSTQFLLGAGETWVRPGAGVIIVFVGATVGGFLLVTRADRAETRAAILPLAIAGVALIAPLLFALGGVDYLLARYLVPAWLPLMVGGAAVWLPRRAGALGRIAVAGLLVMCAGATLAIALRPELQRQNWREVAHVLGTSTASRAIIAPAAGLPLERYLPGLHAARHGTHEPAVAEIDVIGTHVHHRRGCWWGGVCDLPANVSVPRALAPSFHEVSVRRIDAFTVVRLLSARATWPRFHWRDAMAQRNRVGFVLLVQTPGHPGRPRLPT